MSSSELRRPSCLSVYVLREIGTRSCCKGRDRATLTTVLWMVLLVPIPTWF